MSGTTYTAKPTTIDGSWCDATGDPQVDVSGYQSPSRRGQNLSGFTPSRDHRAADALAQSKRDREQRQQRRRAAVEANKAETRERVAQRGARGRGGGQVVTARPDPAEAAQEKADEIARRSLTELQPGQHGAYFERRTYRPWYAPWKKVTRWQQISAWQHTTPPTTGEIATVGDVSELPGRVRTIGKVGPTGAVEW
jgi:hypothetical protein